MRFDNKNVADELLELSCRMHSVLSDADIQLLRNAAALVCPKMIIEELYQRINGLTNTVNEYRINESWRTNPDQMGR